MRILFLSNVVPDRNGGGLAQRMANHLRALCSLGDVTLIVPSTGQAPPPHIPGVTVITRGPTLADRRLARQQAPGSRLARAWYGWRRLNAIDARASRADRARFSRELARPFDLVFAGRMGNAVWWESIYGAGARPGEMRIVDFDDIESRMLARWLETVSLSPFWSWKLGRQVGWLRRLERRLALTWDAFLLCSRIDADRMREATGREAWIVPNGYALQPELPETAGPVCELLFVGSFEHFPNSQGVAWFVASIWPRVRAALGDRVRLTLVGLNATPAILALGDEAGVSVTSNAPSLDPYYAEANVIIAPLLSGSGTRIKLIEAAAKGRAIVSTALGCEGLGFVDGVHAEIADEPGDFAERIVALARDPARRTRLAVAAGAYSARDFSAESIAAELRRSIIHSA